MSPGVERRHESIPSTVNSPFLTSSRKDKKVFKFLFYFCLCGNMFVLDFLLKGVFANIERGCRPTSIWRKGLKTTHTKEHRTCKCRI